jgi:hypothetical protein
VTLVAQLVMKQTQLRFLFYFLTATRKKKGEIDYKDGENVTWSKPLITTNAHHTFISSQYFTTEDILE